MYSTVRRRDGISDNNGLTRGTSPSCIRVGVPNDRVERRLAHEMVAVAEVAVSAAIFGQLAAASGTALKMGSEGETVYRRLRTLFYTALLLLCLGL